MAKEMPLPALPHGVANLASKHAKPWASSLCLVAVALCSTGALAQAGSTAAAAIAPASAPAAATPASAPSLGQTVATLVETGINADLDGMGSAVANTALTAAAAVAAEDAAANTAAAPTVSAAAQALQTRLQQIPGMEGVRVSEHGGVVQLEGAVLRAENRDIAELIAKDDQGVVAVQNHIQLAAGLGQRAQEAWDDGLERAKGFLLFLPLLLLAALMVWGFSRVGRWLGQRPWLHLPGSNPYLSTISRRLVQGLCSLIGIIIALDLLGATKVAGALMGSAGIVGMVIGFAFRDIVENYLAGVLLSIRRPFAPRDHVRIDSYEGRVVALSARTTVLMTLDGNELQLPNATVFKAVILNLSRNAKRRLEFALTIDGKASISTALALGLDNIAQVSGVLSEPAPAGRVEQDSPNGTELRFTAWIDQGQNDLAKVRSECIRQVKNAYASADIAAPSTTYTIITQKPVGYKTAPTPVPAFAATSVPETLQGSADTSVNAELEAQLDAKMQGYAQDEKAGNLLSPT